MEREKCTRRTDENVINKIIFNAAVENRLEKIRKYEEVELRRVESTEDAVPNDVYQLGADRRPDTPAGYALENSQKSTGLAN